MSNTPKIAIVGTVGVPAKYGGFETLVENLVRYGAAHASGPKLTVYCSAPAYPDRPVRYQGADLAYIGLRANGAQSILYDILSMLSAICRRHDTLLVLGVSGCIALPVLRRLTRAQIVTNVDGLEWKREKWSGLSRWVLKKSEALAARHSDVVIADNQAIADHLQERYGRCSTVIAYGGDHARAVAPADISDLGLPSAYALGLCRIEPENNVSLILDAFAAMPDIPLVFVGNWDNSDYGRALRDKAKRHPNLTLLDPIYDPARVRAIRDRATLYLHGHSAGGTNPALVEMMQFGVPIAAYDCCYNRYTTEDAACYFADQNSLYRLVLEGTVNDPKIGQALQEIAQRRYTWGTIGAQYFSLFYSRVDSR